MPGIEIQDFLSWLVLGVERASPLFPLYNITPQYIITPKTGYVWGEFHCACKQYPPKAYNI